MEERKRIAMLKDDLRRAIQALVESDRLLGWAVVAQIMNEEQARERVA